MGNVKDEADWPVLTGYEKGQLRNIAMPLGGVGTGTVSLGGRGDLRDWEICNRPAKGFHITEGFDPYKGGEEIGAVFVLHTRTFDGDQSTRVLEGALPEEDYDGSHGAKVPNHMLPRFRRCRFQAAYPLARISLSDPDVPLDIRLEAFNPLVPADADASGIPVAVLRYVLTNKTGRSVTATVCGTVSNFIGRDGTNSASKDAAKAGSKATSIKANRNLFRKNAHLRGIFMDAPGVHLRAEQCGTMALVTTASGGISYRTAWADLSWCDTLLDFWDDLTADGKLDERKQGSSLEPKGSLAVTLNVPPRGWKQVTFLLTWHFPNRPRWVPFEPGQNVLCAPGGGPDCCVSDADQIGNYYTTRYRDAWAVATRTAASLKKLEAQTVQFVRAFCESDLPEVVKVAALYNVSTLRSQSCFRTPDGKLFGWEGCYDRIGCCYGSCTHVWNYENTTSFLFGKLAWSMREIEFLYATDCKGKMSFRVSFPLEQARRWPYAAADGQMGCIMKLYRDWQLHGDEKRLGKLWPTVRKQLEFCWMPGGWDGDMDGVMEGCQHNTMDVEYYGPNPQMGTWYLGALRAGEAMARYLGENDFADKCRDLFERGSQWLDANLFNGEYYEHQIRAPRSATDIAPYLTGILSVGMGAEDPSHPNLQLGAACVVDQMVGQYMAHVCGLGYLLKKEYVRKALKSVMKYNFKRNFWGHFNQSRTFALNGESGIVMATYPRGRKPKRPMPTCNEVMTGFEYTAAVGMIYERQTRNGLRVIEGIRDRFDGRKRNPFDEAECGHHYVRAMAAWTAVLALTGMHYSAVEQSITFATADKPTRWFWSNGYAWGVVKQKPRHKGIDVELSVLYGKLTIKRMILLGTGSAELRRAKTITQGKTATFAIIRSSAA